MLQQGIHRPFNSSYTSQLHLDSEKEYAEAGFNEYTIPYIYHMQISKSLQLFSGKKTMNKSAHSARFR